MSQQQRGHGLDRQIRGIEIPEIDNKELRKAISEMKAITPYSVSSQFNVKMNVAKKLLEELLRKGIIEPVDGNSRIKIFQIRNRGE